MLHFINSKGVILTGADAFNELLVNTDFSLLSRAFGRLPWLLLLERAAYRWVAGNRILISRILGTTRCGILD